MKTRAFLHGDAARLSRLFAQFPYVAAWCVTQALSDAYGEDDQAVYRHIEEVLAVPIDTPAIRRTLFDGFCRVCDKLGLRWQGFKRMVDVYLLQAGVPMAQLPQLIDAFLRQEAAFGPPPTEATVRLNRWEDDSLEFLHPTVVIPRRTILWDETAWHAALYAKIRNAHPDFVAAHPSEERFAEALAKCTDAAAPRSGAVTSVPRPRLVWRDEGMALRLPRAVGRILLWPEECDRPLRLRGGEDWVLPQPWPRRLRWQIESQTSEVGFLEADAGFAVFDRATGHLVKDVSKESRHLALDAVDVVVVSRKPLSVDGEGALELGVSGFIAFAQLSSRPIRVVSEGKETVLTAVPLRRLTLREGVVAAGPKGVLHDPTALLRVETGLGRAESRQLRVTSGAKSAVAQIEIGENGAGEIELSEVLGALLESSESDPIRIRIELMAPVEGLTLGRSSGVSLEAWCWPGFRGIRGLVFDSNLPPGNLVVDQSRHVARNGTGRLCLDPAGGYATARAVFEIDDVFVPFDLPWPDVTVMRRRSDGSLLGLPFGTRLSVGDDDRFDMISIRCPDADAQLVVRGRRAVRPFVRGLACHLGMLDLMTPANDDRILLRRSSGSELLLFELVPSLAPLELHFSSVRSPVRFRLTLAQPLDAIALDLEDERGVTSLVEVALGRRPVSSRQPSWLSADLVEGNPRVVELRIELQDFPDGLTIARLLARLDVPSSGQAGWRPLRNARGDSFAVALENPFKRSPVPSEELQRRFETLSRWLADCYAPECWPQLESGFVPRWRMLGNALSQESGGASALMIAAAVPPPDHTSTSWVPIAHPLQILPNLYGAPISAFARLAASSDPGIAEMSALFILGTASLRELPQLHPTVYFAFRNVVQADREGVPLAGFDPERFFATLLQIDTDPSAGWFWHGAVLLGPDHWRAAHLRFVERLRTAGLFTSDVADEGPNSQRQDALQRLMAAVFNGMPSSLRPSAPRREAEDREVESIDLWATATLSAFARASRMGEMGGFIAPLCDRLGWREHDVLTTLAFLLRLAPELFAFYLLLWQIAKDHP